jgi:hypothetical protein
MGRMITRTADLACMCKLHEDAFSGQAANEWHRALIPKPQPASA